MYRLDLSNQNKNHVDHTMVNIGEKVPFVQNSQSGKLSLRNLLLSFLLFGNFSSIFQLLTSI